MRIAALVLLACLSACEFDSPVSEPDMPPGTDYAKWELCRKRNQNGGNDLTFSTCLATNVAQEPDGGTQD